MYWFPNYSLLRLASTAMKSVIAKSSVRNFTGISQYAEFKSKSECEANMNGNHLSKLFQVLWLKFEKKAICDLVCFPAVYPL